MNRDIAGELIKRGLLTQTVQPTSIRFLEKVSSALVDGHLPRSLIAFECEQVDINGMAMHDLYRVLKRQSNLFIKRYGMALHIKEHNSKVSEPKATKRAVPPVLPLVFR